MVVLERLEKSLSQLSHLAALTLMIPCGRLLLEDHDAGSIISQDIRCATKILQSVSRGRLGEVAGFAAQLLHALEWDHDCGYW